MVLKEKAFKPLNPPGNYKISEAPPQVESNVLPVPELNFTWGQDIAKWGVILPFSIPAALTPEGTLLALYDSNASTYWKVGQSAPSNNATMTIIFDFGRLLKIRGSIMSIYIRGASSIQCDANAVWSYSQDGENYTTIDSESISGVQAKDADFLQGEATVRYFKMVYTQVGGGSNAYEFYMRQFSVIV